MSESMTPYEKTSFVLSMVAVIVSLLTPVATYFWLDPTVQALRHRRPLLVDVYPQTAAEGGIRLAIQNPGKLPASEVIVVIETTAGNLPGLPPPAPIIDPPSPFTLETTGNVFTLALRRSLGSAESLDVRIPDVPTPDGQKYRIRDARVYSDVGPAIYRDHRDFGGGGQTGGAGGSYP
jgi:hypothetical protein